MSKLIGGGESGSTHVFMALPALRVMCKVHLSKCIDFLVLLAGKPTEMHLISLSTYTGLALAPLEDVKLRGTVRSK